MGNVTLGYTNQSVKKLTFNRLMKDHPMIGINVNLGAIQALQLQVAARSDPSERMTDDMRARDKESLENQMALDAQMMFPPALPAKVPQPHHEDFMAQVEAILSANLALAPCADLTTDAARLQALQIRQQLEAQPYGITNRTAQIALALFR